MESHARAVSQLRLETDLRRPTYGNLLAFLRACASTDRVPDWGPLADVVQGLRSALRLKHAGLSGFDAAAPAMDALINYRNRVAQGKMTQASVLDT